ncbi:MAG: hypothetical protein K8R76_07400 [Candidatus Aegiribacteria sp.]|nr:hypothetical protein [Candidatus Aegiribacteria sp.]
MSDLSSIFRRILKKSFPGSYNKRNVIHFPKSILHPSRIVIYSGPATSDIWPAMYLTDMLQNAYPKTNTSIICNLDDGELLNMLQWKPQIYFYEKHPSIPSLLDDENLEDDILFFYPYTTIDNNTGKLLMSSGAGIRIAPLETDSPYINLRIRTESTDYPTVLHQICSALGINSQTTWKPVIQQQVMEHAENLTAPVSGRHLPYIVTSSTALSILEKHRAEIPLRTVSLSGKSIDFENLERETRAAMIADSEAVATDSEDLWCDACALGIPVVALDTSGTFIKWSNNSTVSNESEFIEAWSQLLRKGW